MKRRDFLAVCISMAGVFAVRPVLAQPGGSNRGAVVIGVDKAGDLPKLKAAVSGARTVAEWLKREGFDVKLFVDDVNPVMASDLFAAINAFVDRGTLDQLVVYFAGHGFINSYSEYWLLSKAPDNPNEAVSLIECVALAKQSGIPNVVFISDACRSRADSLRIQQVRGSLIFPNKGTRTNVIPDVDQFLATLVGDPSWEVPVAESAAAFAGIYTTCFLDAFKRPYDTMVRTIDGKQVIPNNRLKPYLAREVPRRAQAISITLNQRPDTQVVSDETTYIGHVAGSERLLTANAAVTPTIADVAGVELKRAGAGGIGGGEPQYSEQAIGTIADESGFDSARNTILQARGLPSQLSARTGFAISGQRVESVVAKPGIKTDFVNSPAQGRPSALVEVDVQGIRAASVALRFVDGSGTVIAALDRYVGNVVVDEGMVSNVSYVPSSQSPIRSDYEPNRLEQLHAAVATAARFGVFRIEGPKETRRRAAEQLAGDIRVYKRIDPTLGIYAAYAYADAGLVDQVISVSRYMHGDLGTDLFDVAMLSGALSGRRLDDPDGPVPFCPMLSQGWSLLRVKDVHLPQNIDDARDHVRAGLWTTFDREGMQIVEYALRSGQVK